MSAMSAVKDHRDCLEHYADVGSSSWIMVEKEDGIWHVLARVPDNPERIDCADIDGCSLPVHHNLTRAPRAKIDCIAVPEQQSRLRCGLLVPSRGPLLFQTVELVDHEERKNEHSSDYREEERKSRALYDPSSQKGKQRREDVTCSGQARNQCPIPIRRDLQQDAGGGDAVEGVYQTTEQEDVGKECLSGKDDHRRTDQKRQQGGGVQDILVSYFPGEIEEDASRNHTAQYFQQQVVTDILAVRTEDCFSVQNQERHQDQGDSLGIDDQQIAQQPFAGAELVSRNAKKLCNVPDFQILRDYLPDPPETQGSQAEQSGCDKKQPGVVVGICLCTEDSPGKERRYQYAQAGDDLVDGKKTLAPRIQNGFTQNIGIGDTGKSAAQGK